MILVLLLLLAALALWASSRKQPKKRNSALPSKTCSVDKYTKYSSATGRNSEDFTRDDQIRNELARAGAAVGGLNDIQKSLAETFLNCKQVMEESFEIAESTKDEITRSSRLECGKECLERLESLTRNANCPLKLRNQGEIWSEYYRLCGSSSVAGLEKDKAVDLSHYIGRPWSEIVADLTGGANLVDGKQTWELAEEYKHDLPKMLECCQAELKTMEQAGQIPAPFYFERAAILFRKAKEYEAEVKLIELYLSAIEAWNLANGNSRPSGGGARHQKILQRYEKAKQLVLTQKRLSKG